MSSHYIESVNTDPVVSPVKSRNAPGEKRDEVKEASKRPHKERARPLSRPGKGVTEDVRARKSEQTTERPTPTIEAAPKTPAPTEEDLFSPTDTQPSTSKPDVSHDTPPPADLRSATDTGRPSRRPRGAVSYAEPNLRDKMRRPGKELVDAVGADARGSRDASVAAESVERDLPMREKSTARKIKVEPERSPPPPASPCNEGGVSPPPSPLAEKRPPGATGPTDPTAGASESQLPSTVLTDRRRRSSSISSGTLAALLAGSAQRISRARGAVESAGTEGTAIERADSAELGSEKGSVQEDAALDEPRVTRRHSSMADLRMATGGESDGKAGVGSRAGSSRRATMTGSSRGGARRERPSVLGRQESEPADGGKPSETRDDTAEAEHEATGTARRLERAASRRRSMML